MVSPQVFLDAVMQADVQRELPDLVDGRLEFGKADVALAVRCVLEELAVLVACDAACRPADVRRRITGSSVSKSRCK
jgi:hypothetical protein